MVPTHIHDLSLACVASVKSTVGFELDFSSDTLPLLDHYVKTVVPATEDEILSLVAPMVGAYFGSVIDQRIKACRWHAPEHQYSDWRLEMQRVFFFFNPVGIALEVISSSDSEGWNAHLQVAPQDRDAIEAAVGVYGDVRESDYYSFGVRFEVIEQVAETLMREAQRRGDAEREFGSQYYADTIARWNLQNESR